VLADGLAGSLGPVSPRVTVYRVLSWGEAHESERHMKRSRSCGGQVVRVPWEDVETVAAHEKLRKRAPTLGLGRGDDRLRPYIERSPEQTCENLHVPRPKSRDRVRARNREMPRPTCHARAGPGRPFRPSWSAGPDGSSTSSHPAVLAAKGRRPLGGGRHRGRTNVVRDGTELLS
jgi:hypothetical protein